MKKRDDAFDDAAPTLIAKRPSPFFTLDDHIVTAMLKTAQTLANFVLAACGSVDVVPWQQAPAI
ncbi:MAG TPA: hypothetical protein PLE92_05630, partial [Lentisphaeria bacterium]|nr:hypothetical protein [Lentisphaeria bacterium]